ncbi:MAG: zinc-dependent metalloprotease [Isosphaeraceae bacterium]
MAATMLVGGWYAGRPAIAQEPQPPVNIDFEGVVVAARQAGANRGPTSNFRDFNEVTKGAEKIDGLFTLYKTGDHLYAEIRPDQFNQPLLTPTTIARGMAQAGIPVGDDDRVLILRRVGDRIQVVRRNVFYKAPAGTPLDKAVKQNYTDTVIMALPIVTINTMRGGAPLIDLSDIFMNDIADLRIGAIDRSRSQWTKVKGFPNNLELELEATYTGGMMGRSRRGGDPGTDPRGITLVLHFSIIKAQEAGYRPRVADDRVGHFLSATKDFGISDPDSNFVRYINRWRLEKADPRAKLSPPKKQIIWYVEDTVPLEYRPYVEEGISEWNKAFEKIGFKNAIAVRWQEAGRDDFDPEDTNYCTFRWITSDSSYAMSCLRANPITGEMIDGDVVFDASFIRYWKDSYALLVGGKPAAAGATESETLAFGEVISPILASKMGYGQPIARVLGGLGALNRAPGQMTAEVVPADQNPLQWQLTRNLAFGARGFCQFNSGFQRDLGLAAIALADTPKPEAPKTDKDKEKDKDDKDKAAKKPEPKPELPEEFLGQAIKHITMHEVGHSLGLRHNFKSSTMLSDNQLHDTAITRSKGLVGSVMDYSPINLAPKGKKQGDYYSTTIGPYDYWAIEYAYKPVDGDEASELKKIAARAPEHDLVYATDEDSFLNEDPYVNRWDLGSDPCQFGRERIELAAELLKDLDARVVKDGDSWARVRRAFSMLLSQYGDGATLAAQFIGGQSVSRDHKGDKDARDPIVPVSGAKQRDCLKFLAENILSDRAFQYSPALLRRLGTERWYHWGNESGMFGPSIDISVLERILGIQKIVLAHCLSGSTLARIQNQQLQADAGADPLRMDEVFRSLTDGVWGDLDKQPEVKDAKDPKAAKLAFSTLRRNLQREYLRRLTSLVLGDRSNSFGDSFTYVIFVGGNGNGSVPADARALARLHLKEVAGRINMVLETKNASLDDTSRAHLEECKHRIAKVLEANLDIKEP